jgi:hypothetical protein
MTCEYNRLTTLIGVYDNIEVIICKRNKITEIEGGFPKLNTLDCSYNRLLEIPSKSILNKLKKMICSGNLIKDIGDYDHMEELICDDNTILYLGNMPKLKMLSCSHNFIKNIPNYPLLENLVCYSNQIVDLSWHPNLIHLDCSRNLIFIVPEYPNLKKLFCNDNKILELPYYSEIEELECTGNNLININNYPNLKILICNNNLIVSIAPMKNILRMNCSNNQLTTLDDYPVINFLDCSNNRMIDLKNYQTLTFLNCSHNQLITLPNINTWINLQFITYHDNNIQYLPPHIQRIIDQLLNNERNNIIGIYDDSQNVHDSNIQTSIKKSIDLIIRENPNISFDDAINEIKMNDKLSIQAKEKMIQGSEIVEYTINGILFKEILLSVWSLIRIHKNKNDILEILNEEMIASQGKCFTGLVSHLINTLNGFDDRVKIEMNVNHQIANIIESIRIRLNKTNEYTPEKHRYIAIAELKERQIQEDVINTWVDAIE